MNRHMTTAYSNEIDLQNLKDPDPGSGSEIRDPDPAFFKTGIRIRSETDRIRNTAFYYYFCSTPLNLLLTLVFPGV